MISLNLLPDIKKEFLKAQRTRNLVISGAIVVSAVAGGFVVLLAMTVFIGQNLTIANVRKDVDNKSKTLSAKPEVSKYLTVQNQLTQIKAKSGDRAEYARLFSYLQQLNPAPPYNISLFSLELNKTASTISFTGSATNFETVNNFKNAIENATLNYKVDGAAQSEPFFPEIISYNASLASAVGNSFVSFDFVLSYAPKAFDSTVTDTSLQIPKLITSDSDKNAPKQIFTTPPTEVKNGN